MKNSYSLGVYFLLFIMEMNWIVIVIVSVIAFAMAPVWFGMIFWNLWMKIHGMENMSKEELDKMNEWMWKLLALEAINTLIMVAVLAFLLMNISGYSPYLVAVLLWLGFLYPNTVSSVIWGNDEKKWQPTKIMILAGFNFVVVLVSAFLLTTFW